MSYLQQLPSPFLHALKKTTHPIVLDEKGIVNAVIANLSSAPQSQCWNHLLCDISRWLHSHGAKSDDLLIYLSDMRELFHQPTQPQYKQFFKDATEKWSTPFWKYYTDEIALHKVISTKGYQPYGVYGPYSGVTNNQADCMVLSFHYLQSYYLMEIA